ncbi:glycosyl-transferase for dystroglycan-domain-containing protein [Cokeromyces recurvatus]|uniref:glycosyl-transferase for dystroglycan-domain-containing protein n=1 Tax=Cokeromyces recurvatus TaxID=90255 RepID=UPI0022205FA6|nr:glycosyl-transferase for dystroglycan-domain-containing protein [Cokeromyces recurvatus]KAI7904407.1 glycosyl-transferase for dystroglycan-domain-containing protein [Cokeromyces recurvatus]
MSVDFQSFMSRKGTKTLGLVLLLSCLALLTKYCTYEPYTSHFKRAIFFKNDLILQHEARLNNQFTWADGKGDIHQLPIETILSKSFSLSSYSEESQIIPYYYKSQINFMDEDITIITLVTRNRIPNLSRLATKYQGPISVTIHVSDDDEGEFTLEILEQAMNKNSNMRKYVDVHVIRDKFDRELNLWRNVARLFARTEYVMQLDIDFYPSTDIRHSVLNNPKAMNLLRTGQSALVIPAFEYSRQEEGLDYRTFPKTKSELVKEYKDKNIEMFHSFWLPGHAPTDYDDWLNENEEIYKVTSYQYSYEPYVIFKNQGSPWCDERFAGYGSNKAACLYELYISGVNFYVLPNDFIIHQTHAYPDEARQIERYYNRRLYTQFREETCIRLARRFITQNKWEDPKSENLREECASIKPYQRAIARFV